MSDRPMNDDPMSPEEAAARAALRAVPVPPLDEVTKRRLVRTAVAASPSAPSAARTRRFAALGAAAAVLAVLVGTFAFVLRDDDSSSNGASTRSRGEPEAEESQGAPGAAGGGSDAAADTSAPLTDLGDLGAITSAPPALTNITERLSGAPAAAARPDADGLLRVCATPIESAAPGFQPTGFATATYRESPVIVFVDSAQSPPVAVVVKPSCEVLSAPG
jgi:hypothetical protein